MTGVQTCALPIFVVVHPRLEEDWEAQALVEPGLLTLPGADAAVARSSPVLAASRPSCLRVAMDESAVTPRVRRDVTARLLAAAPGARLMTTLGPGRPGTAAEHGAKAGAGTGALPGRVWASIAARAVASLGGPAAELPYSVVSALEHEHAVSAGALVGHASSAFDALAAAERLVGPGGSLLSLVSAVQRASTAGGRETLGQRSAWRLDEDAPHGSDCDGGASVCGALRQSLWFRET